MKWWRELLAVLTIIGLHFLVLATTQFTAWPELLVYSHLLQNGFLYFGDIIQPYFPTLPYFLTWVYGVFGLSVDTLRGVSYIVIFLTDILMGLILYQKSRKNIYVTSFFLSLYILLQLLMEGNGLWFDSATIPFLLLAIFFWDLYQRRLTFLYLAGCCLSLGLAFVIKQTAVLFLFIPIFYLLVYKQWRQAWWGAVIGLIPLEILFILFRPSDIWYWNMYYPFYVMGKSSGYMLLPTLRQLVTTCVLFMPLLLVIWKRKPFMGILLWFVAGLVFVYPRFAYFHLQPALAFFIIFLVLGYSTVSTPNKKWIFGVYFVVVLVLFSRWFVKNKNLPVRFFEPQVYETAAQLNKMIPHNSSVFFYNDMGNVMVAGGFVPPKPWAYTFPWYMEIPGLQERMIAGMMEARTEWIVFSAFGNEGIRVPGSYVPLSLNRYVEANYEVHTKLTDQLFLLKVKKVNP